MMNMNLSAASPRLRTRRKHPTPVTAMIASACCCMAIIAGLAFVLDGMDISPPLLLTQRSYAGHSRTRAMMKQRQQRISSKQQQQQMDAMPREFLDLWPSDYTSEERSFRKSLGSCLSLEATNLDNQCPNLLTIQDQSSTEHQQQMQRIGVLRPPGRLGDVFSAFVDRVVQQTPGNRHVELIPTSHTAGHHGKHNFTKIIRFAAMPLLLQAVDVYQSVTPMSTTSSPDEFLWIVRQLIRWHCPISQQLLETNDMQDNIPLLTVTLDRTMTFPVITTRKIQSFLTQVPFSNTKSKTKKVRMEDLTKTVMDAINSASELVRQSLDEQGSLVLRQQYSSRSPTPMPVLWQRIQDIVDEEVVVGAVCNPLELPSDQSSPELRLVAYLLSPTTTTTEAAISKLCQTMPMAHACTASTTT